MDKDKKIQLRKNFEERKANFLATTTVLTISTTWFLGGEGLGGS